MALDEAKLNEFLGRVVGELGVAFSEALVLIGDELGLYRGKRDDQLLWGTDRFFGAAYRASLVGSWIPALDGVESKLRAGAHVADVGCGFGAATITMAEAYPASTFAGYDADQRSIEVARKKAADAGVADRVTFEVARATDYPGSGFDLVAVLDALHDMGDPVAASAHILRSLDVEGTLMLVEPFAGDRLEENLNPVGRLFYAGSTMICVPGSLAQEGAAALGNQSGEKRRRQVVTAAGFSRFRRAAATPFNLILEARP